MGKKQQRKKIKSFTLLKDKKNRTLVSILIAFALTTGVIFAATGVQLLISQQSATILWSNNSTISFSTWGVTKHTHYVNEGDNSTIIWNYLQWYYYDSVFWYFSLNWSTNKNENVRIIWTTSKCWTWFWYKLWWKAKWIYSTGWTDMDSAWYIDFDHNSSTFVYYCENDKKLHWKWYSRWIWYQDFEWIWFEILADWTTTTTFTWATDLFLNDNTNVDIIEVFTGSNSNASLDKLLWEEYNFDADKGSIFYIIK